MLDSSSTQYAGNYIYKKNPGRGAQLKLAFFNHPEGYVSPKNASDISQGFKYVYRYKDHLGNVRLSYTDQDKDGVITPSIEIIEESNYYPFGLKHKGYNNVVNSLGNSTAQKFGYNGVELNESLGLNLHEMDFRLYDPAIGRFNGIDPVPHHSQGTSVAFDNNPIIFSDPSGADSKSFFNKLFNDSKSGDKWVNNNGTFTNQRTGQSETCDDCEGVVRVKIAEPRNNSNISNRARNWFNPMVNTHFKLEYGDGAYSEFLIDSEGYITIDLNNLVIINEANGARAISFLRALSRLRTAGNMAKLVRNANWIRNTKLRGVLSQFYRANATIGNGSSAAALMHEARAGVLLSRTGHLSKVGLIRNQLVNIINSGAKLTKFEKQFVVRQIIEANRAIRTAMGASSNYTGSVTRETLKTLRKFRY